MHIPFNQCLFALRGLYAINLNDLGKVYKLQQLKQNILRLGRLCPLRQEVEWVDGPKISCLTNQRTIVVWEVRLKKFCMFAFRNTFLGLRSYKIEN